MVIKADSPATFAEKYIIESIWNNHFPQGSILPAERELSELIGVTRTTLREVLQRLARDGWLTIQHGKPTRVNNYMDTSGLNILDTLVTLDGQDVQRVLTDLLAARTDISSVFMRYAVKGNAEESSLLIQHVIDSVERLRKASSFAEFIENSDDRIDLIQEVKKIVDKYGKDDPQLCEEICLARAFNYYDYRLFQGMAGKSGNTLYVLTINGLRKIYTRVGGYYFMKPEACELALNFYRDMKSYCDENKPELVADRIRLYGRESGAIWYSHRVEISKYMYEEEQ
ncbi:fatty acid metabolism transcriptional regulator FadR [Photobacterium angustum]|uniref:fatty acid metabolism transcriptional regulator FadR n=1 Tax=Photobacterium angustum TaxID=661 RepID=UPI0005E99FDF|nr:fatty acid metabolism transcriptional regulator FadR [Photobacterium angustum]KJG02536.1 GntR family transcriptional regulator [Photobacterium angustum]KJG18201.1 GntR family transcriptional regulator [Photobacterium angustum]KJG26294.1 GntR family transcriptional regulator [Photobacterium angustum]KJG32304.1 GntR family transcriptional regulator [Photobacterium angustum]PSV67767.1 fatty acid metabolism transcriptional regulator FadR [Photobacterium angustum]